MVFFNYATMQMAAKIVYYGPGLCGKTTNLHFIYTRTSPQSRGEMVSLETETDRTLFFDLLPIDVGVIGGFKTRLQLYTVPGQVFYNTTRKLVLKGVDGIVFVADSQKAMLEANRLSFENLKENLTEIGLSLDDLPLVVQLNKRDLPGVATPDEVLRQLDPDREFESTEAVAATGTGVFETLKLISKLTLRTLRRRMTGDEPPRPATGPRRDTSPVRVTTRSPEPSPLPAPPASPPSPPERSSPPTFGTQVIRVPVPLSTAAVIDPVEEAAPGAESSQQPVSAAAEPEGVSDLVTSVFGVSGDDRRAEAASPDEPAVTRPESPPEPADAAPEPSVRDSEETTGAPAQEAPARVESEPPSAAEEPKGAEAGAPQVSPPEAEAPAPQPVGEEAAAGEGTAPPPAGAEPEIDFSQTVRPARRPEVKTVKVRSSIDVMAELEALRKRATQAGPARKKERAPETPLAGSTKRDLQRTVTLEASPESRAGARSVRIKVSFENSEGVLQTEEQVIEVTEISDVRSLSVDLKIAME